MKGGQIFWMEDLALPWRGRAPTVPVEGKVPHTVPPETIILGFQDFPILQLKERREEIKALMKTTKTPSGWL